MNEIPSFHSVELHTSRLTLREFAEGDAEAIQTYAGDPDVTRFTSWGPNTLETSRAVLAGWILQQSSAPRTEYTLAIVRKQDGELIGGCGFGTIDWTTGTATFGYVLRKSAWGLGYATEASRAVSDWALHRLGLRRLVAHCEPHNLYSGRVLTKLGFELQEDLTRLPRTDGEMRLYLTYVLERK